MFGDDYFIKFSCTSCTKDGLGQLNGNSYGINKGFEQTWYVAKDGNHTRDLKNNTRSKYLHMSLFCNT